MNVVVRAARIGLLVTWLASAGFAAVGARVRGGDTREIESRQIEVDCSLIFADEGRAILRSASDVDERMRSQGCLRALDGVDFARESVVGIELSTGYCRVPLGLRHRVLRDDPRKRYVVEVRYIEPGEPCRARSRYDLWLGVPRIPDGYTVDFDVAPESGAVDEHS